MGTKNKDLYCVFISILTASATMAFYTEAKAEEMDHSLPNTPPLMSNGEQDIESSQQNPSRSRERTINPHPRRAEGFAFRIEIGRSNWNLDPERLESQVGESAYEIRPLMVNNTQDATAIGFHMGYNILGHATLGAEITGTGWNVMNANRGGAGLVAGSLAWHPLEAIAPYLPEVMLGKPVWDLSFLAGGGWGVLGKDRALRGMHILYGARLDFMPAPWVTIGLNLKYYSLRFSEYVLHWDRNVFVELPDKSGGSVFVPSISFAFRAGTYQYN